MAEFPIAVQAEAVKAARAIADLPPEQWAGWAVYILNCIEAEAQDRRIDPAPFLAAVKKEVKTRLDLGRW